MCNCNIHIGSYLKNEVITIPGILAISTGDFTFEIWGNGTKSEETVSLTIEDPLTITNTFKEGSCFSLKVKLPAASQDIDHGVVYATDSQGNVCFDFCSIPSNC